MKSFLQNYIVQTIVNTLNMGQLEEYAQVKKIGDNIDDQIQNVIICGISSSNKVYPMTDDYQFKLDIAIRSWIADDENGEMFENICSIVREKLKPLGNNKAFKQTLTHENIVGVVEEAEAKQVTEDSNILTLSYLVYASF